MNCDWCCEGKGQGTVRIRKAKRGDVRLRLQGGPEDVDIGAVVLRMSRCWRKRSPKNFPDPQKQAQKPQDGVLLLMVDCWKF